MKEQKIKKIEENETTNSVSDKEMLDRYKKDIGALPTNKSEKHNLVDEEGVKESSNKKQKLSSKKSKVTSKDFIKPE